jgi:hypothetical protein
MRKQEYFILMLLTNYPLDTNKLKEELLQSPHFRDSEDVDIWIEKLTTKDCIQLKDNKYFATQIGLDKLINRFLKNEI